MKVFISWSGEHSHAVALVLRDWLQAVLHHVEPFVSSEDIQKGALWGQSIATELDATTFAILCIVPGNVAEPWLVFEAGAIWRGLGSTRVAPFLVGVDRKDVRGPLSLFQSTVFDKDDVRKLFHSVNKSSPIPVEGGKLDRTFDACWSTFAAMVEEAARRAAPVAPGAPQLGAMIPVAKGDAPQFADLAAAVQSSRFSEDEKKILVFLSERPKGYPTADDLAQALQQKPTRVKYYIDRLKAAGLVGDRLYANSRPAEYYLREPGRAYVVENGLI